MTLNKTTQNALQRHLPLLLEPDRYNAIELRAQTQQFENGGIRTCRLSVGPLPYILRACLEVFEQGGQVNVDQIPWNDIDIWQYGWTPALAPLRDNLRERWRNRPAPQQPDW